MRLRHGVAALLLVLALAGCGGGDDGGAAAGGDSAATIAPASAAFYASIDTDLDGDEWEQLNELLDRFPGRERLTAMLLDSLREEDVDWETDVKPALGPTLEVVGLGFENAEESFVALAKPADKEKFEQLVTEGDDPGVTREVEGWTVAASTEAAIDRFEQALDEDALADEDAFDQLMSELPEEALAKVWVDGEQAEQAGQSLGGAQLPQLATGTPVGVAFAVDARDEGLALITQARTEDVEIDAQAWGELAELVPADAFAFFNLHGQDGQLKVTDQIRGVPEARGALGQFERLLGVTLEDVSTLFQQELLLWVRPGTIIPEVTLVLEVDDEEEARATVDRLVEAAGGLGGVQSAPRQVGDVEATEVDLGMFALLYAAVDGKLVVTTQSSGIEALGEDGDKLVDSDAYEDALDAAELPDGEEVMLYVDLARSIDVIDRLAQLGDEPIPPDVRANLEPLGAVVMSAATDFENASGRMFLHVR